jgi:hypothetical protein
VADEGSASIGSNKERRQYWVDIKSDATMLQRGRNPPALFGTFSRRKSTDKITFSVFAI